MSVQNSDPARVPTAISGERQSNRHSTATAARGFGLLTATALVTGNIIGGGIFALPSAVAPYGTVSLVAFVMLTAGSVALALLFGRLAGRTPLTGGPYIYAREAFGEFAGFQSAWSYWAVTWASNAVLAVAVVGYIDVLVPLHGNRGAEALAALACLWLPAAANFAGTRWVGAVQVVSTVLKLLPLLFIAIGGVFFVRADNFGPFDATGNGWPGALSASAAILLYSYLGVESASVSAGEVRNPERNVGRASVLGTLGSAVVYMLVTFAVFGMVPHQDLLSSEAPLSDAVNVMLGGTGGGVFVALAAVISMTGCLNGWILMSAQMPYAAARDGLFPAIFARVGRGGVPGFGVLIGTALSSALVLLNFTAGAGGAFRVLVLVTTFTATVPYLLSAAAQLYWLAAGTREGQAPVRLSRLIRDLTVAFAAFAFSLWLMAGAGYAAVYQGTLFLFAGVLVYVWFARRLPTARK